MDVLECYLVLILLNARSSEKKLFNWFILVSEMEKTNEANRRNDLEEKIDSLNLDNYSGICKIPKAVKARGVVFLKVWFV